MIGRRGIAVSLVAWLLAYLALPAAGFAQGSGTPVIPGQGSGNALTPFNNPAPVPTQTAPPATVPSVTTSTTGGGLNGTDAIAIAIGAVLVLGGISFYIWRDARKRAPVRQHATAVAGAGSGPRQRLQKSRKLSPAERKRRKRGKAR